MFEHFRVFLLLTQIRPAAMKTARENTFLITGGCGYVGHRCVRHELLHKPCDLYNVNVTIPAVILLFNNKMALEH